MPLIDLKTNLKSLGYGNDRPDGGSSNQPYVVTPIPDGETSNSPDFLLRNGYLNPVSSFQDTERLLKYFTDIKTPSGLLFTTKQELLERQNPKLVNIDRVYTPFSTIFQASLLSVGEHLNKQGINPNEPSYYVGGRYGYYFSTKNQIIADGLENRLTIAYTAKIENQDLGKLTINPFGITRASGDNILLSYSGGPGSILGIGNTNIRIQNPTQTKKSDWSYEKSLEEEVFPLDIGFLPTFITTIPNLKGYLTPSGSRPSINWRYNFFLDRNTVSALTLQSSPTNENFNTLYIYGENTQTNSTPGGLPQSNIANNENINKETNVGVKGRFDYFFNITDGVKKYLVPSGKNVLAIYKYGASTQYVIGEKSELLDDNERSELIKGNQDEKITRNETITLSNPSVDKDNNVYTFSYAQTLNKISKGKTKSTSIIRDFRDIIVEEDESVTLPHTDYTQFNREKTYKTSATNYRGNYIEGKGYQLDPNTAISPELKNATADNDLIDFYFSTYNAANTSSAVIFKAYLDDWSDSYKGEWGSIKYMGRAESLYKYEGFSRNGNVSFNVPILSKGDLNITYARLNQLSNAVAPFYSTGTSSGISGLMTGVVTKITMGDYWRNMPILVNTINYTPISDMGWDIGRNIDGKKIERSQLPKGIKVTLDFIIIHNYTPQYGSNFIIN